ncbi:MAG: NPP1 family protein [Myxococcota bacterium]
MKKVGKKVATPPLQMDVRRSTSTTGDASVKSNNTSHPIDEWDPQRGSTPGPKAQLSQIPDGADQLSEQQLSSTLGTLSERAGEPGKPSSLLSEVFRRPDGQSPPADQTRDVQTQIQSSMSSGDWSWMPTVEFVGRKSEDPSAATSLPDEADAAFVPGQGTDDPGRVLLYEGVGQDMTPQQRQQTLTGLYTEELGHALDHRLNGSKNDAWGDEGELFRMVLDGQIDMGNDAHRQQIADIRAQDDTAVAQVDGVMQEVELAATGTLPHDQLAPIIQDQASLDPLITKFQPQWSIESGVKPRPAVNAEGYVNAGLKASGAANGDPSNIPYDYGTQGQVYSQLHHFGPGGHPDNPEIHSAIMYAMYWPKDNTAAFGGHRHDWENVVVMLDSQGEALGTAYSGHGDYRHVVNRDSQAWSNNQPLAEYYHYADENADFDRFTHATGSTSKGGASPPLVDVTKLKEPAKSALSTTKWGSAIYPLRDDQFLGNLDKAVDMFNIIPEGQNSYSKGDPLGPPKKFVYGSTSEAKPSTSTHGGFTYGSANLPD